MVFLLVSRLIVENEPYPNGIYDFTIVMIIHYTRH